MSGNTILTNAGHYFFFDRPRDHSFPIEEIAHALSNLCRFTGHIRQFYSVAQHSVLVSFQVPPELAMCALMHDASEAYLGDVSSPLKRMLPDYKAIEVQVEEAIAHQYGLPYPMPVEIRTADMTLLITEKRDLCATGPSELDKRYWPDIKPLDVHIIPLAPQQARRLFLDRYAELST